jgi:hypothetical protein
MAKAKQKKTLPITPNEFVTACIDFVSNGKVLRKGCGLAIKVRKEEGRWKPYNMDGSFHRHEELPRDTKPLIQLPISPIEDWVREVAQEELRGLWPRKVVIYKGNIPPGNPTNFTTTERCGVETKSGKCQNFLEAIRAVNYKEEWDKSRQTLNYDFRDLRYYLFCYVHGPYPAGQDHWVAPKA